LVPYEIQEYLPFIFSFIGLAMVLRSFTERKNVLLSWMLVIMNHFWTALAISFNERFKFEQIHLYLSGIVVTGILGYICLSILKSKEKSIDLDRFQGHAYEHPRIALVFLIACLGVSGFPITPTFIGEDLIFTHIHEDQASLAFFTSVSFIVDGIAIMRIYARIFLGPNVKSQHEMAYRSS
jgi:NADH-quinone oxidoreductase subunit L